MELIMGGVALLVAAVALYCISRYQQRLATTLVATGIASIAELQHLRERVSSEVGSGFFSQRVGIEGTLECDEPLQSELSGQPCAAFRYQVIRRWEETVHEKDEQGKPRTRTRTGNETVAGNERRTTFWVRDGTGRVLVQPDGAVLEMEKVVDRFEPAGSESVVRFGRIGLDLGKLGGSGRRTLGYHSQERILPPGRTVYVLGTASDRTGSLAIGGAPEVDTPFLISLKTREDMVRTARQTSAFTLYGACACLPVGLILIALGLLSAR